MVALGALGILCEILVNGTWIGQRELATGAGGAGPFLFYSCCQCCYFLGVSFGLSLLLVIISLGIVKLILFIVPLIPMACVGGLSLSFMGLLAILSILAAGTNAHGPSVTRLLGRITNLGQCCRMQMGCASGTGGRRREA
eukprot:415065-Amphidinium_carterae.1